MYKLQIYTHAIHLNIAHRQINNVFAGVEKHGIIHTDLCVYAGDVPPEVVKKGLCL